MATALCKGPECGRCLSVCPADAVELYDRDWESCDRFRSPHGFANLIEFVDAMMVEGDPAKQKQMLRSETSFNLWQSILRGAGVITGCRRCADVCPVGEDYKRLEDALAEIPEDTDAKRAKLAAMRRAGGANPAQTRWTRA
jgi:ferredoxin